MADVMGRPNTVRVLVGALGVLLIVAQPAAATDVPTSTNYRFDETSVGVSSMLESNSANFRATSGAGDTGIGNSGSANFQTESGSNTTPDPNLTFSMTSSAAGFGTFSPTAPRTATTTFSVTNYTSFGYVVQIAGPPPSYGSNQIDPMSVNAPSQPGIEQFGINVVANTSPVSFGANPQNGTAPNTFGFGQADPNYGTPNQFRYVSGETIAQAPKSSGKTDYTISYLVNVTPLTPGGTYGADQTLIVTGTY
jgi:hypothetical protein